ncbi:unnamed protein product [Adineta ricciae]|uniref:DED domain-containing protein n=1 Tax=Adineta ricciae TaxID=249248 RepID=A0A814JFK6_ADIRI|nr:unnamed protein product [Adineta ricciae]
MAVSFEYGVVLAKMQSLLSDRDRERLYFLLDDDIQETFRKNYTISKAFHVLEFFLQKSTVNNEDCDFIIEAFTAIHCHDTVKRLKEYQAIQTNANQQAVSIEQILSQNNENPTVPDQFLSRINTELSSPFLHRSTNSTTPTNTFDLVPNKKQENTKQPRRKICQRILIGIIVLSVTSLPLVIVLSQRYIERTSKLKQGEIFSDALELFTQLTRRS